jgi:hypothetical protein
MHNLSILPVEMGPVVPTQAATLIRLIKQDNGIPEHKKKSLLEMLNSPEAFDHLMAGAAGMIIARAAANYSKLSSPAKTLLSLAGFGLGNIIYNHVSQRKHTSFDPHTGKSRILL